ncbi:MAG: NAD-dependent epimerase/dehydratase family protein [Polyangiaceae bacterium]|jgi:dihydroflavonol-4-reductase
MKYLVTGGTGFLGRHLVAAIEAAGHDAVPFARSLGGDVLDARAVRAAASDCDGVFHCAGRVSRCPGDAEELYRVHVNGTKSVLDASAAAGVRRVVVVSTSAVVGLSEDPARVATENDAVPVSLIGRFPYYRSKLFAEQVALGRNREGFEVLCVNPSLLLGPGDVEGSSTGDVKTFLEGGVLAIFAGGLSFVDVRDAADALRLAMDRGRAGERYLVAACNMTIQDFLQRLARVSGRPAPWLPLPRSRELARFAASIVGRTAAKLGLKAPLDPATAEMAQLFWYVDSSKAERDLGWTARDPNVTLYETVEDLRARGVVWPRDPQHASAAG